MKKRTVALLMAAVLLFGAAVGGTLAYLTAKTDPLVNTFTKGNVAITLTETGATNNAQSFKMIPGTTITKDPKITVKASSEACYVFVKIDKSAQLDTYITYAVDTSEGKWKKLTSAENVWYQEINGTAGVVTTDTDLPILTNNQVAVKNVTAEQMALATDVTLTFTGYAVQKEGITLEQAWATALTLAP